MDNSQWKVLIADDEPDILEILEFNLKKEGYKVFTARDGNEAIDLARVTLPDLVILDIMMPGKTGVEVCEIMRANPAHKQTLIIFLTAISDEATQIKGLSTGADDYLNKPISPKVLVSKVQSLLRRATKDSTRAITIEGLTIDPDRYVVQFDGRDEVLAKKEFELLYLLASKPGRVFLRNEILDRIWGNDVIVGDRTIDVHIRKIRQKLGVECITTVKGVGYKFELRH
jgi:two-component system, OmpR family, alkaline phosphatase synthesis response regulator PhoP